MRTNEKEHGAIEEEIYTAQDISEGHRVSFDDPMISGLWFLNQQRSQLIQQLVGSVGKNSPVSSTSGAGGNTIHLCNDFNFIPPSLATSFFLCRLALC